MGSDRVGLVMVLLTLAVAQGAAAPLQGQDRDRWGDLPSPPASTHWSSIEEEGEWWKGFWGIPEPNRIYGGLWALHLRRLSDGISSHHLIGGTYRGIHAGTFVNTHEGRSWTLALGRSVIHWEADQVAFRAGYRLGLLAGYDEALMDLAERWPVLPAGMLVADARYRRLGLQMGWSWIVVTFGGFVDLGGG